MLNNNFNRDIIWSYIINFSISFRNYFLIAIFTGLGKWEYGIFSQFRHTLTILIPYASLGLINSIVRFNDDKDDYKRLMTSSIVLLIGITIISYVIILFNLSNYIFKTTSKTLEYLLCIQLFFISYNTLFNNYLKGKRKFKIIATATGIISFVEICGCYILSLFTYNLIYLFYFLIFSSIMLFIIFIVLLREQVKNYSLFFQLHRMMKYSIPLLIGGGFNFIMLYGDRYIITNKLGIEKLAEYSLLYAVANFVLIALQPIEYAIFPKISNLWNNKQMDLLKSSVKKTIKYELLLGIIVICLIILFQKHIIKILSDDTFIDNSNIVIALSLSHLIFALGVPFQRIVSFQNPNTMIIISIIIGSFNLICNMLIVNIYGILGASIITLISYTSWSASYYFLSKKELK